MYVIQRIMDGRYLSSNTHQDNSESGEIYTLNVNHIRVFTSLEACERIRWDDNERVLSLEQMFQNNIDDSY